MSNPRAWYHEVPHFGKHWPLLANIRLVWKLFARDEVFSLFCPTVSDQKKFYNNSNRFPSAFNIETDIRPGEFVMRTLFAEFTVQVKLQKR